MHSLKSVWLEERSRMGVFLFVLNGFGERANVRRARTIKLPTAGVRWRWSCTSADCAELKQGMNCARPIHNPASPATVQKLLEMTIFSLQTKNLTASEILCHYRLKYESSSDYF